MLYFAWSVLLLEQQVMYIDDILRPLMDCPFWRWDLRIANLSAADFSPCHPLDASICCDMLNLLLYAHMVIRGFPAIINQLHEPEQSGELPMAAAPAAQRIPLSQCISNPSSGTPVRIGHGRRDLQILQARNLGV